MQFNGRGVFTHRGRTYGYETRIADTDYGSEERELKVYEVTWGHPTMLLQEAMSVRGLIEQFKDFVDWEEQQERYNEESDARIEEVDRLWRRQNDNGDGTFGPVPDYIPPHGS